MDPYFDKLIKSVKALANPVRADFSRKYLRDQFECLGIPAKELRACIRNFLKEHGFPEMEQLGDFILSLWELPEREFQYVAIEILQKRAKKLRKQDIEWIELLIARKSWWDTVDALAAWICGTFFILYPEETKPVTGKWMQSGNLWLQRSSLLFQLKYKKNTDTVLMADYIEQLSMHTDFFIRKAIGWVLREYSKTDRDWVSQFINTHSLSGLSTREASKYL
jgi:3-methyladenine DNA glycosylase AlkD